MTPQEIEELTQEIADGIQGGVELVGALDPRLIPLVILGRAIDKMVPGVSGMVARWVEGNPPTDQEKAELKAKLSVLADPNLP